MSKIVSTVNFATNEKEQHFTNTAKTSTRILIMFDDVLICPTNHSLSAFYCNYVFLSPRINVNC